MLVEFRVSNYRSFREEQTLSMVAGSPRRLANNIIDPALLKPRRGLRLLKVAVVYGANASGKSNLVRAFSTMERLVCTSATGMSEGDPLPGMVPFRLSPDTRDRACRFEVLLCLSGVFYRYGLAATSERIVEEWLNVTVPNGPETQWFHRLGATKADWSFGSRLRSRSASLRSETRSDNCLVLSTAARLGTEELAPLYRWFRGPSYTVDMSASPDFVAAQTAQRCEAEPLFCSSVSDMLRAADMGVASLRVEHKDLPVPKMPVGPNQGDSAVVEALRGFVAALQADKTTRKLAPVTVHVPAPGADPVEFQLGDEAGGTQRLFAIAGPVLDALRVGATVFVDEVDCSMHTLLVQQLLEVMQDPEVNAAGAQFVLTTHDTNLQRPDLLRPDQVWLTEKNSDGATELYSLHDFRDAPRGDASFGRGYLAGKYGGVPVFGNLRRAFMGALRDGRP